MDYLASWKGIVRKNRALYFCDIILNGYAQTAICLNPLTGFLLSAAIFYLSKEIWLLTFLGILSSTCAAYITGAKPLHINCGIYGFNGVVLGIAWLWFFKMSVISIILLVITAAFSSVLMRLLMDLSSRTKVNLPVFSVPSVILIWLLFVLMRYFSWGKDLSGPDQRIFDYWQVYYANLSSLSNNFTPSIFFQAFHKQLIAFLVILLGIFLHSRIAGWFSSFIFFLTLILACYLEGKKGFLNIEFYLYNTIPCGIALAGTFLVFNRKVVLLAVSGVITAIWLTFLGLSNFMLPVFVAPFNFITILFIWLVKSNLLKRSRGFFAVPMDFISTAEFGLHWYKGEIYADKYWRQMENQLRKQNGQI